MSDVVIRVDELGKRYRIGATADRHRDLRDALTAAVKAPFRNISHLRRLPSFADGEREDTVWALKNVSFEVKQGEVLGVIGRNGAGKSTLLKVLSRITDPTTGSIKMHGRVGALLEVGTGFHPELTGRENVYLNGSILGMSKAYIDDKFDEIIEFSGVEKFIDTPVKRYSSGMYLRLAFSVAAHLEPEILVVDEVLAVGDAEFQKKCLGKMGEVARDGRTVLFVSHNMSAIQSLCSTAIRLEGGTIAGQGNVADQIGSYLRGVQLRTSIDADTATKCGNDVHVTKFEFSPNPIESKQRIDFTLHLAAERALTINALVILIYSALGERVAILDLRREDAKYKVSETTPFAIKGSISSLPLVEGDYSVGLYIDYGLFQGNVLGLLDLVVSGPTPLPGFAPFPPSVRGIVELDCSIVGHQA